MTTSLKIDRSCTWDVSVGGVTQGELEQVFESFYPTKSSGKAGRRKLLLRNLCSVYTQLPGTFDRVPSASLKIKELGADAFQGTVTYGKRYAARQNANELSPST